MLKVKWLGWKVTTLDPVGKIKVDQPVMVEDVYNNR